MDGVQQMAAAKPATKPRENVHNVLAELESLGKEATRNTFRRHGVGDNQYGVLFSALEKIKKRIKTDHELAIQLWENGNHDGRMLAMMIADPKQADSATLDRWVQELDNYVVTDALSGYVSASPLAREKAEQWIKSDNEWIATAGWNILGSLTASDSSLPDAYFEPYLAQIERELHDSQNRVRYAMNNVVIAIGVRSDALEPKAIAAAERIGTVDVDHGQTNCKTPDAIPYIHKTKAYRAKKAAK